MQNDSLVSVVIASYNNGQFLEEGVESILNQQYKNFEIIIVDDGSTDNTKEIVIKYEIEPKVRYFYQENQGQAKAKNKGIIESNGDYIAFLDADDKWTQDKLSSQLPCFNKSENIGVVFTNLNHINEYGDVIEIPKREFFSGNLTSKLLVDNVVTGMSSIVKKECFDKVGIFDEQLPMGIDYDLWLRISTVYEFYFLDKVTYLYRQWSGQMSHNKRGRYENGIRIMKKFLENNPGLVEEKVVNEAWAHTYVGSGNAIFQKENKRIEALNEYRKALSYKLRYIPAWKSIIKLILNINKN